MHNNNNNNNNEDTEIPDPESMLLTIIAQLIL